MNKQHLNIKCSIEATTNYILPFLDTKMYKEIGKFVTSVYREDTFSGVYTNCTSLIPLEYKFSLLDTLFRRCFCLVYDISNFHLKNIRTIFLKIVHAHKFTDKCIFKFVKIMFEHKPNVKTVWKKEIRVSLPYLGRFKAFKLPKGICCLIRVAFKGVQWCDVNKMNIMPRNLPYTIIL